MDVQNNYTAYTGSRAENDEPEDGKHPGISGPESFESTETFLFENDQQSGAFEDFLKLNLPEGYKVSVEQVKSEDNKVIGNKLTITSPDGKEVKLDKNENGQLTLKVDGGTEIEIPAELAKQMKASGNDEVQGLIDADGDPSKVDQIKAEKTWGMLSDSFKDDIYSSGEWAPGEQLQMEGESFGTIKEALDLSDFGEGENKSAAEKAIVKYAAENGFLDDGIIQENEASEIASFIKSDKFETRVNALKDNNTENMPEEAVQEKGYSKQLNGLPELVEKWGGEDGLINEDDLKNILESKESTEQEKKLAQSLFGENKDVFKKLGGEDGLVSFADAQNFKMENMLPEILPGLIENWGGDDAVINKEDLEKIVESDDATQDEKDLARYLLDNEDALNKLGGEDGLISLTDAKNLKIENEIGRVLPDIIKVWGGEDGLIGKKDLEDILASDSSTAQEKEVAKYLLDNKAEFDKLGGEDGYFSMQDVKYYLNPLDKPDDGKGPDMDLISQQWQEVIKDGKISTEELAQYDELSQYIIHDLGYNAGKGGKTGEQELATFVEDMRDGGIIDPKDKEGIDCLTDEIKPDGEFLERITGRFFTKEAYDGRVLLNAENGQLPKVDKEDAGWVEFTLENGQKITFRGEDSGKKANEFAELYNKSEEFRKGVQDILNDEGQNKGRLSIVSDEKGFGAIGGGHANTCQGSCIFDADSSTEVMIHEVGHLVMEARDQGHHSREHDIWNASARAEALKNDGEFQEISDEIPGGLSIFDRKEGKEFFGKEGEAAVVSSPEVLSAYDDYHKIKDSLQKGDSKAAIEAFKNIDPDAKIKICGKEYNLRDIVAEELMMSLDSAEWFNQDEKNSEAAHKAFKEMLDGLGEDKGVFDKAAETLHRNLDDFVDPGKTNAAGGLNEAIDIASKCWDNWNGSDDKVSVEDLQKYVKDENRPESERRAIQYLLDHPMIIEQIDVAGKVGMPDGKMSNKDFDAWKSLRPQIENATNVFNKNWDNWAGDDGIVTVEDLENIADDPNRSQEERDSANFLLDHGFVLAQMDDPSLQHNFDGKISRSDMDTFIKGNAMIFT